MPWYRVRIAYELEIAAIDKDEVSEVVGDMQLPDGYVEDTLEAIVLKEIEYDEDGDEIEWKEPNSGSD